MAGFPAVSKQIVCEENEHNARCPDELLGKYGIDVAAASKADAVRRIVELTGIEAGLIAGDSGNDIDMLFRSPSFLVSVVVGGAHNGVRPTIRERIEGSLRGGWGTVLGLDECMRRVYIGEAEAELGPDSILRALNELGRGCSTRSPSQSAECD